MIVRSHSGATDHFAGDLVKMQELLYFYALQLTEDREDALDLVQETAYKALKNRKRLHNTEHIRAWLYTILKNTYINYLRSSHYRLLVYDTNEINLYSDFDEDHGNLPPDEKLLRKELQEIVSLLPGVYKKPIRMLLSGYSYKEIAQQMDIPIGTVKSRIHLGKKQIRKVYMA
ncbi:MAG: sigma-70 family RNA polymerase sigma factor [Bacteroidales bacterium]|nr:sigma-70 family RNA polymerase sigma factor [Bacteroidales bacterium]